MHRDIKPENILIESAADLTIKLADFDLTKKRNENEPYEFCRTLVGTPSCMHISLLAISQAKKKRKISLMPSTSIQMWRQKSLSQGKNAAIPAP